MIEQHLKTISSEFEFPYNHLNKILTCNLEPPFTIQWKDKKLKFYGVMSKIEEDKKEDLFLQFMQLNLALEATENLNLGLTSDDKICLNSELSFDLDYKQIKNHIESFANHLDKISTMIQDLNKKS